MGPLQHNPYDLRKQHWDFASEETGLGRQADHLQMPNY